MLWSATIPPMKLLASVLVLSLVLKGTSHADVSLPAVFSKGMVLQRGVNVPVWGWATAGEEVSVTLGAQVKTAKADDKGNWSVSLDPMLANEKPEELVVAGKNKLSVADVLVGEVWLCSGQSNMQMTVSEAKDAEAETAAAKFPQIRMFNVERIRSNDPQKDTKGSWMVCDPTTVGKFSAAGYFFGRKLHQELAVPVGLINSSWGGTRAEAWTSREALEQLPSAARLLREWAAQAKAFDAGKAKAEFDKREAAWKEAVKKVNDANAKLAAGAPKAPVPPAPRPADDPNTTPHRPSVLYNQMIAPLIPFAIKGAIWYQGESNQRRAVQYQELLPTLINDWRARWQSEFSFYIVQLAGFGNGHPPAKDAGAPDAWAELQEAQMLTALTLPHCGVAVANDIGDQGNIHPKNKQEVGRRLALWALAKDYGKADVEPSGPLYLSSKVDGKKVRIRFSHAKGLKSRDGGELRTFQIAGRDQVWHWASAKIEGNEVVVWSDKVPQPVGVRYAWAAWSQEANLVNGAGLPASCFRTDEFLLSTMGVVSPFE